MIENNIFIFIVCTVDDLSGQFAAPVSLQNLRMKFIFVIGRCRVGAKAEATSCANKEWPLIHHCLS